MPRTRAVGAGVAAESGRIVLGYDRHGSPVFGNALAPIPGTDRTWLVGDSRSGAVIMRTYRIGG
jgi:hypothetical protein